MKEFRPFLPAAFFGLFVIYLFRFRDPGPPPPPLPPSPLPLIIDNVINPGDRVSVQIEMGVAGEVLKRSLLVNGKWAMELSADSVRAGSSKK